MKVCKRCRIDKSLDNYSRTTKKATGVSYPYPYCKACARIIASERHYADPVKAQLRKAANYAKNRELQCAASRAWRAKNRERNALTYKTWAIANRPHLTARQNARYSLSRAATPNCLPFIDRARITESYELASARSMQTGMKHHVDHVFPLRGRSFCGLNVPWNLRIVAASENVHKYNNVLPEFASMLWSAA